MMNEMLDAQGKSTEQAVVYLGGHGVGYAVALVFFDVSCLILGHLIYKAAYFPKVLGMLLTLAGAGYLTDSFASLLVSNYAGYPSISNVLMGPAFVAEIAMCVWRLVKGVMSTQGDKSVPMGVQVEGVGA